jgi:acetylglutamate kinase
LVHGGGVEVSRLSDRLGVQPVFSDGIRITSDVEMELVEMVLSGAVNKRLVRRFLSCGVPAVGISAADGRMVTGVRIADRSGRTTRTAQVEAVRPELVRQLWAAGYVPILSSPASDNAYEAVNINADDVAFAVSQALGVEALVFLSDVPGVLVGGEPQSTLTPAEIDRHLEDGTISGGMVPKAQNAVTAVSHGVNRVVIGSYEQGGDLGRLLAGDRGTSIEGERT